MLLPALGEEHSTDPDGLGLSNLRRKNALSGAFISFVVVFCKCHKGAEQKGERGKGYCGVFRHLRIRKRKLSDSLFGW